MSLAFLSDGNFSRHKAEHKKIAKMFAKSKALDCLTDLNRMGKFTVFESFRSAHFH